MRLDRRIRIDLCSECGQERPIAHQGLRLCEYCNNKRRQKNWKQKEVKKRSKQGASIASQDDKFFRAIWKKRPHRSEVSDEPLGDKFSAVFMSHVLPKGSFPKFRHLDENIVLMTFEEHRDWEHGKQDDKWKERFKSVIEIRQRLTVRYHQGLSCSI